MTVPAAPEIATLRDALHHGLEHWGHQINDVTGRVHAVVTPEAQKYERALAELDSLEARLRDTYEKAKLASTIAAAPDYDEEAIRDALWAVVDAALAPPDPQEPS